ncbi:MAG: 3-oxoacyl-ACP synthase [Proteobacteria bacterium]|nr:3-oxoacyl-ACP synthase [Pseudomonadota bacterium]
MIYSRISGVGSHLPGQAVTNDDLVARGVNTSDQWIVERTGIRKRHLAAENQTASDLALEASRAAIADAGIAPGSIDLIIVATSTPDYIFPSTAALLQAKLGIRNGGAAFDVQAVCSGFVYGLAMADKFIRSGSHRCALVVGTEVFSRILDWNDRGTCVLFGDGAGAVIVEAAPQPGILASALHADGSYADILSVPGNVCGGKVIGSPFLQMDGQAVFKFAVKVLAEVANEVLATAKVEAAAVDWLIPTRRTCASCRRRRASSDCRWRKWWSPWPTTATLPPRRFRWHWMRRCATAASGAASACCWKVSAAASPGARLCSTSDLTVP